MDTIYVLKALSDEKRMEIIRLLSKKKYCVRALSRQLNISESAVSQHIQVLKKANLLKIGDKNGYNIHYEVNGTVLKQISEELKYLSDSILSVRECGGNCKEKKNEKERIG